MTEEEKLAFRRGSWSALDSMLLLLCTYEDRYVKRSDFYQALMELRPIDPETYYEKLRTQTEY